MLIGDQYKDYKMYRGIKHYDQLPLTSGDLHEYADTTFMKNTYFLDNIIGSGTLNEPTCAISSDGGIKLNTPSILLLKGDISIIQADPGPLVTYSDISTANYSEGLICIAAWYQHLDQYTTLRKYGGVKNTVLPNDLVRSPLDMQISTRYQLRWDTIILNYQDYSSGNAMNTYSILNRDANGNLTEGSSTISIKASTDVVRLAYKTSTMSYAATDLFIVPIARYKYSNSAVQSVKAFKAIRPVGSSDIISQNSTPASDDYSDGTIWFDTSKDEFSIYMKEQSKFLPTAPKMKIVQDIETYTMSNRSSSTHYYYLPDNYTTDDVVQVIYKGLVLVAGEEYEIQLNSNTGKYMVALLNFPTTAGDKLTLLCTRLAKASD